MAMKGRLNDLSLAELIEISGNHRKTGQLKIKYPSDTAYFYFNKGELVDARISLLQGPEALYYALTLSEKDVTFRFDYGILPNHQTIKDSWKFLLLEGLRRLDENTPTKATPLEKNRTAAPFHPPVIEQTHLEQGLFLKETEIDNKSVSTNSRVVSQNNRILLAQMIGLLLVMVILIGIAFHLFYKDSAVVTASNRVEIPKSFQNAILTTPTSNNENKVDYVAYSDIDIANDEREDDPAPVIKTEQDYKALKERGNLTKQEIKEASQISKTDSIKNQIKESSISPTPQPNTTTPSVHTIQVKIFINEAGKVTEAMVESPRPNAAEIENRALQLARQRRYDGGRSGWITVPIIVRTKD
jgi:hypothetical protein